MVETMKIRYPILPNTNDICLPTVHCRLLASNGYDKHLFESLKEGDFFVMAQSLMENVYGNIDSSLVLPGVKSVGILCKIEKIQQEDFNYSVSFR